jgi:hypothetical protein
MNLRNRSIAPSKASGSRGRKRARRPSRSSGPASPDPTHFTVHRRPHHLRKHIVDGKRVKYAARKVHMDMSPWTKAAKVAYKHYKDGLIRGLNPAKKKRSLMALLKNSKYMAHVRMLAKSYGAAVRPPRTKKSNVRGKNKQLMRPRKR